MKRLIKDSKLLTITEKQQTNYHKTCNNMLFIYLIDDAISKSSAAAAAAAHTRPSLDQAASRIQYDGRLSQVS
jgi:hypothetical protein